MNNAQSSDSGRSKRALLRTVADAVAMFFTAPLLIPFVLSTAKPLIIADTERWLKETRRTMPPTPWGVLLLLAIYAEFRSLYYHRLSKGNLPAAVLVPLFKIFYRECSSLFIWCRDVGPGLFIQHGFSTAIAAKSVGENCWINQQVTIGYSDEPYGPIIGNNVRIFAGAKVLGGIVLGNNVTVGANAVVVKDVPDNCTVVGVPARIIKRNGIRVSEELGSRPDDSDHIERAVYPETIDEAEMASTMQKAERS